MKRHLTGFGISALLHAGLVLVALPVVLLQSAEPPAKALPLTLALAQFQPPPPLVVPVVPTSPVPKPSPKPEPKPEPKPVPKPITPPKPVVKAAVAKPKSQLVPKPVVPPEPKPIVKAVAEKPPSLPKSEPQPESESVPKPSVVHQPVPHPAPVVPQPVRPIAAPKPVPAAPPAAPKPAPAVQNPAAEAAYRAKLQSLIAARKQYPSMAEKMEAEGTVSVAFSVLANGTITGARVASSSGNQWLDQAAVQAVNAVSGALPFPADIHKTQWAFTIGVNFRLE
jgi:protein TonB